MLLGELIYCLGRADMLLGELILPWESGYALGIAYEMGFRPQWVYEIWNGVPTPPFHKPSTQGDFQSQLPEAKSGGLGGTAPPR